MSRPRDLTTDGRQTMPTRVKILLDSDVDLDLDLDLDLDSDLDSNDLR